MGYNEEEPERPVEKAMTHSIRSLILPLIGGVCFCTLPAYAAPAKKSAAKVTKKTPKKPAPKPAPKPAEKPQEPAAPKVDPAITQHAAYPDFIKILNEQVERNSADYYDAVRRVLEATDGDETAVQNWMQAAAQEGNAAAKRWMISTRLSDLPPEAVLSQPVKDAYKELLELADKGFVPAMLDISNCMRNGIGVEKDAELAEQKLMEACKSGDLLARFQWLLLTNRLSHFEDKDKPEVASEIERGNHYVIYKLSTMAPDAATQVEWMKNAAGKGSGESYYVLSSLALEGHPKESLTLLKLAVHLHYPEAMFALSAALADSGAANPYARAGVTPNTKESILLLKAAALIGNVRSGLALANAYYDGMLGLPQDYEKAYFHFNNPQVSRNAICCAARGLLLLQGLGVKQDTEKGYELLDRAAKSGYAPAMIMQAYAHFKGLGVPANAQKASDLLSEAAALGAPVAYVYLAYITATGGPGLEASPSRAKSFINYAALDMGDKAQKLYDELIAKGDWQPHP